MNRILSRSLRPAILSSRFSSSQSESVPDLSRIIEQIDPAAGPNNDATVLINDANFFESIDTSALNGLQEFFFNSYWSIGDLAGVRNDFDISVNLETWVGNITSLETRLLTWEHRYELGSCYIHLET